MIDLPVGQLRITGDYRKVLARGAVDVVVLGAGISGLLVASELSRSGEVVVLEKAPSIPLQKYWLTNHECVRVNPDLEPHVDTKYEFLDFIAYDRTSYRCNGTSCLWDSERLIGHLRQKTQSQGGRFLTNCRFYGYQYTKSGATVFAGKQEIHCRLIIDCMGYSSPLMSAKQTVQITGYYMLYGARLELERTIAPIGLYNIIMDSRAKYIEVFPRSDGTAYATIISPEKSIRPLQRLSEDFHFLVEDSLFGSYFAGVIAPDGILGGVIPVGRVLRKALKRVYFFGESAQVNPATTATGLTRMLLNYRNLCEQLVTLLNDDRLDQSALERIDVQFLDKLNRKLQLNLFEKVLEWDSDDFRRLVLQMRGLESSTVHDLIFGEVKTKDLLTPASLVHLFKTRNWILLSSLLKTVTTIR